MKVLLIKSGNLTTRSAGITPPLGLMYIASYIKQKRNDMVRIFDIRLYKKPLREIYSIINEFRPDLIGISALTIEASALHQIADFIKQFINTPIIVGGPHVTSYPHDVLNNKCIDIGVIGEGEITFKEILDGLELGGNLYNIDGIAYRENGNIVIHNERGYIKNLDELPFPAWNIIDLAKYAHTTGASMIGFRPYMLLLTSRGCPFQCIYCHNIFGKRFRARSADNVLREMNSLIKDYHINDFEIIDDISNFDKDRIKIIFKGIIDRNWKVNLSFPNGLRADMLDEETIHLMSKAGVSQILIAVETVSPRLQKTIKKNLHLDKVKKMIDQSVNIGMFVMGSFILGLPTETVKEAKETVSFACKTRLHVALFYILTPFGGTEIERQIETITHIPLDIKSEDFDYHAMPFNASDIPNKQLHRLYTFAYIRFYFNPIRVIRILKTKTMWRDLPYRLTRILNALGAPRGNKKLVLEPIDFEFKRENNKAVLHVETQLLSINSPKQSQNNIVELSSAKKK